MSLNESMDKITCAGSDGSKLQPQINMPAIAVSGGGTLQQEQSSPRGPPNHQHLQQLRRVGEKTKRAPIGAKLRGDIGHGERSAIFNGRTQYPGSSPNSSIVWLPPNVDEIKVIYPRLRDILRTEVHTRVPEVR